MSHLHLVPDTFGGIFQACTGKLPHMVSFEIHKDRDHTIMLSLLILQVIPHVTEI